MKTAPQDHAPISRFSALWIAVSMTLCGAGLVTTGITLSVVAPRHATRPMSLLGLHRTGTDAPVLGNGKP